MPRLGPCSWRRSGRLPAPSAGSSESAAGAIIVPLLIVWLGYGEREATGTSMVAIIVIAAFAVTLQAVYGNVDPPRPRWSGIPAIGGAHRRHRTSAAASRAGDLAAVRRAPGGDRGGADHPVSAIAGRTDGIRGGMVGGLLGVGGGILFVPALAIFKNESQVRAEATLAAGDRAGGDGGRLAPARLRQRAARRGAGDRRALADRGRHRRRRSPTPFPSGRWSSPSLVSLWSSPLSCSSEPSGRWTSDLNESD